MQTLSKTLVIGFSLSLFSSATILAQVAAPVAPPATPIAPVTPAPPKKVVPEKEKPKKKAIKIYGWKEWAWVIKPEMVLRAKLDTGARTSSIHATNIEQIEIDGKQWIKFTISDPADEKSIRLRHKAPLVRISKVKNDTGGLDERFVVSLEFQIGNQKIEGEFNLNDREKMTCAVLIGRNLLMQLGVVDAGRTDLLDSPKNASSKTKVTDTKETKEEKPKEALNQQ